MFGCNPDLKNSLCLVGDTKLAYVAGHNVVVCKLEDRSQHFLPGSSDAECIKAIALSEDETHLAICERGVHQGKLTVYDLAKPAMPKSLPEKSQDSLAFTSKDMVCVAFNLKSTFKVVTLTGAPDF